MSDHIDVVQIRNKAREIFIASRTKQEQKFNEWYSGLLRCPEDVVLNKLPFDWKDMKLSELIPEWYKEVPDPAICSQQVAKLNEKIEAANVIIDELNREGLEKLKEYTELCAKG